MDIIDLFSLDLRNISTENLTLVNQEDRPNGGSYKKYIAALSGIESGLFDIIEIIEFETGNRNVTFRTVDVDLIDFTSLSELIVAICKIYGPDVNGKTNLTLEELEYLEHPILYSQFNRRWDDYNKHKYPLAISRTSEDLSLTIWNLPNN